MSGGVYEPGAFQAAKLDLASVTDLASLEAALAEGVAPLPPPWANIVH